MGVEPACLLGLLGAGYTRDKRFTWEAQASVWFLTTL